MTSVLFVVVKLHIKLIALLFTRYGGGRRDVDVSSGGGDEWNLNEIPKGYFAQGTEMGNRKTSHRELAHPTTLWMILT